EPRRLVGAPLAESVPRQRLEDPRLVGKAIGEHLHPLRRLGLPAGLIEELREEELRRPVVGGARRRLEEEAERPVAVAAPAPEAGERGVPAGLAGGVERGRALEEGARLV